MGGGLNTVGSMVGIGGGPAAQGMNWQPGGTPILAPVTEDQAKQAYEQSQTGIANQAAFLAALQGQNGIANQSSVYNQLQNVANGTGPNPAQAMLAQATGNNVANQAALMAGQRGAGSNVGLIARQAAQQGGNLQQQAAAQAATMQANQSLGALNQLGALSSQQVAQQAAATGALTGAQQSEQGLLYNQIDAQNRANVEQSNALNNINAQQAGRGANAQAGVIQGIAGAFGMAEGGPVPGGMPIVQQPNGAPMAPPAPTKFAKPVSTALGSAQQPASNKPDAETQAGAAMGQGVGKGVAGLGSAIKGLFGGSSAPAASSEPDWANAPSYDINKNAAVNDWAALAKGGEVPAMLSPGEIYLPPKEAKKAAEGKIDPIKHGKKVPGKAKVAGDSLKNDTVPAKLEEGGFVIPRSIMQSDDPSKKAAAFIQAHMDRKSKLKKGK